jgi:two-component system heavy metal sensor histidine kinase CusS
VNAADQAPVGQSLSGRLSRALAVQAFAILGLVCTVVYGATSITLATRQDATLSEKKAMVRHILAKTKLDSDPATLEHTLRDFLIGHEEMGLVLRLSGRSEIGVGVRPDDASLPLKRVDFDIGAAGSASEGGMASLYLDASSDAELLRRLAWILAMSALGGAVTVSLGSLLMVRRAVAPLHGLVQQLRLLRADRLDLRLDGALQPDELQPVIAQFNELLSRLDKAYRQLEAFNADVAHELNTPLSVLIGSCHLGLQRTRSADELREILTHNLEDLDRMAGIVRDMLFLSKADQGARIRAGESHSLRQIALDVVDFHEAALLEAGLHADVEGDAHLAVDPGLMRRALSNLLSNAARYAAPGSQVQLRIAPSAEGEIEVTVQNQGQAIPADELHRVFERFYRADHSRAGSDVNHGLGLAIVDAIASMHGGRAFARSEQGLTQVGLYLPRPHRDLEQVQAGSPS